MGVVSLEKILGTAFTERYGVPAVNIFNDLTMEGVLAGAVEARSPVIVQTSVKTVRSIGAPVLAAMWRTMTDGIEVPVCLHLDHCPDREVVTECLRNGWNSVLFDASEMPVAENLRQTIEVVAEAREYGAHVEGEIESITGVEDGHGSDEEAARQALDVCLDFIDRSGVDVFAPSIGNAHGSYKAAPVLDYQRVEDIVTARSIPIALHGGSGLSLEQFHALIARGCAKVNISTALKETYMKSSLQFLEGARERDKWDPPSLFSATREEVVDLVVGLAKDFGSAGKAA
ncbi:class II fructose-bisphosphate aldolase [Microbacterium xanthum]|uniref:class II fructose-bisphosphate aldolase n=1 Tax=Microbacterium xanthum TaxID=3079794 RepID=UPI002AD30215|nr:MULTISPECIES: class II fructose-bisphosphate aldolase [unclassified Microbacterium]MDZ8170805.1 class II fructose-bisphosphate aldolase [Microbacterium sp. KSW-48]MDZ8201314.1 class II fructose-bisphosphate aldolase [Microbacterium sp. SSW1-59]